MNISYLGRIEAKEREDTTPNRIVSVNRWTVFVQNAWGAYASSAAISTTYDPSDSVASFQSMDNLFKLLVCLYNMLLSMVVESSFFFLFVPLRCWCCCGHTLLTPSSANDRPNTKPTFRPRLGARHFPPILSIEQAHKYTHTHIYKHLRIDLLLWWPPPPGTFHLSDQSTLFIPFVYSSPLASDFEPNRLLYVHTHTSIWC